MPSKLKDILFYRQLHDQRPGHPDEVQFMAYRQGTTTLTLTRSGAHFFGTDPVTRQLLLGEQEPDTCPLRSVQRTLHISSDQLAAKFDEASTRRVIRLRRPQAGEALQLDLTQSKGSSLELIDDQGQRATFHHQLVAPPLPGQRRAEYETQITLKWQGTAWPLELPHLEHWLRQKGLDFEYTLTLPGLFPLKLHNGCAVHPLGARLELSESRRLRLYELLLSAADDAPEHLTGERP